MCSLLGWPLTVSFSIPLRLRPYGSLPAGNLQRLTFSGYPLSSPHIIFSTCVRDLSVMLDPELTFIISIWLHRSATISCATFGLFLVLTHQSTLTLVHAFVTSSCSSLLVGLPLGTLARLDYLRPSSAFSCPSCWKTAQGFSY